jgi:type I restriction enzyme M protein
MISKMKAPRDGGTRIAIVLNGSAFAGEAGTGLSEIRRWIIENDWLEAIVGLPTDLFYNTPINTYVWIVSNRKSAGRAGRVQLVDARDLFVRMRKSLGDKSNEIAQHQIDQIVAEYRGMAESYRSRILPNEALGYRRIVVERPRRVGYFVSPESLTALRAELEDAPEADQSAFGHAIAQLEPLEGRVFHSRADLDEALSEVTTSSAALRPEQRNAILEVLEFHDPAADPTPAKKGGNEPDPSLRDTEDVPLTESVQAFFEREVEPYEPDAWVGPASKMKIGYAIPFAKHFYRYSEPRPLEEIDNEIRARVDHVVALIQKVTR